MKRHTIRFRKEFLMGILTADGKTTHGLPYDYTKDRVVEMLKDTPAVIEITYDLDNKEEARVANFLHTSLCLVYNGRFKYEKATV